MFDKQEHLLMKVKRSLNRLYMIIIEIGKHICLMSRWMRCLRPWHVNYQAMSLMLINKMMNGMPNIQQPKGVCDGCLVSKQTRK